MNWSQDDNPSSPPPQEQPSEDNAWRQIAGGLLGGAIVLATVLGSIILAMQEAPPVSPTVAVIVSPGTTPGGANITPPPCATPVPSLTPELATPTQQISAPTPTAACAIPPGWTAYTVRAGDTLSSIAASVGSTEFTLIQGNCLLETEMVVGQLLYVPPPPTSGPTPVPTLCGPPRDWVIYRVEPGDTLYGLSVRYGTTVNALASANCLTTYALRVGQPLYVPPVAVPTRTPVPPTPTAPISPLPTNTPAPLPTEIPSATLSPDTPEPSLTPEPSFTPSDTPAPTWTPQPTDTFTPTNTPVVISTEPVEPSPTP